MVDSDDGFRVRLLAILAIAGLIAGGAVAWWSFQRGEAIIGPFALTSDGERLWVATDGRLIRVGLDGRGAETIETGLAIDGIYDLAALPDGRLLVAERNRVMAFEPSTGKITRFAEPARDGPVDLAVGRDSVYLATNKAHRIDVLSHDGLIRKLGPEGIHRYPNDLAIDDTGKLWVADTNRHAITVVNTDPMRFGEPVREIPLTGEPHTRPLSIAVTSRGDAWAVVANSQLADSRLVHISKEGTVSSRPMENGRPQVLLATERGVLAADPETIALDWVAPNRAPFGDEAFRAILEASSDARAGYRFYLIVSLVILVGSLALAVITAFLDARAHRAGSSRTTGEGRLEPARGPLTAMAVVGVVLTLAVVGLTLFIAGTGVGPRILVVSAGLIPLGPMMVFVSAALGKTRIGVEGDRLVVIDHRGRRTAAGPERISHSERVLVVDGTVILIRAGVFPLFDRGRMMREVYPLLGRARTMGAWRTEWLLLRHGHPVSLLPFLVLIPLLLHAGVLLTSF